MAARIWSSSDITLTCWRITISTFCWQESSLFWFAFIFSFIEFSNRVHISNRVQIIALFFNSICQIKISTLDKNSYNMPLNTSKSRYSYTLICLISMLNHLRALSTAWKVSKYGVFSPNAEKKDQKKTPYLDTFHAVKVITKTRVLGIKRILL